MTDPTADELAAIAAVLQSVGGAARAGEAEGPLVSNASNWKRTARLEAVGND